MTGSRRHHPVMGGSVTVGGTPYPADGGEWEDNNASDHPGDRENEDMGSPTPNRGKGDGNMMDLSEVTWFLGGRG
jgi:hypothetical protein